MMRAALLAAALLLAGCGQSPSDYFPLGGEQRWQYDITRTIKGETRRQKLIVANLRATELAGRQVFPRRRLDGAVELYERTADGVLRVYPDAKQRQTVLPAVPAPGVAWQGETQIMFLEVTGAFSATFEARMQQSIPLSYVVESADETVEVAAGRFAHCLRVKSNGSMFAGGTLREYMGIRFVQVEQTDWYAPGVGLVKRVRREFTTPAEWNNEYTEELSALL
jgi:hypothetical protein